jgi:hypothetical protein
MRSLTRRRARCSVPIARGEPEDPVEGLECRPHGIRWDIEQLHQSRRGDQAGDHYTSVNTASESDATSLVNVLKQLQTAAARAS